MKKSRLLITSAMLKLTGAYIKTKGEKIYDTGPMNYRENYFYNPHFSNQNFSNPHFYKELSIDIFVIVCSAIFFIFYQYFSKLKNI